MSRLAGTLAKLHDATTRCGFALACASLLGLLLAYCFEVVKRYVMAAPTAWAADLVAYLLAAMLFLSLPAITAAHRHIVIRSIVERLSPALSGRLWRLLALLAFLSCLGMAAWAVSLSLEQAARDAHTVATLQIPKSVLSALLAYGLGSSSIYFLRSAVHPQRAALVLERGQDIG